MAVYELLGARSSVEISGKSSLHPIHGTLAPGSLTGKLEATVTDAKIDLAEQTSGHVEFPVEAMHFGNNMYDRELPKRLDTSRYPSVSFELERLEERSAGRYTMAMTVGFHGKSETVEEEMELKLLDDKTLSVSGEHRFDIREFGVEPPRMLGMKVHPEFTVKIELVAQISGSGAT
jgi:polyisoprenoid-binding protein YceI